MPVVAIGRAIAENKLRMTEWAARPASREGDRHNLLRRLRTPIAAMVPLASLRRCWDTFLGPGGPEISPAAFFRGGFGS